MGLRLELTPKLRILYISDLYLFLSNLTVQIFRNTLLTPLLSNQWSSDFENCAVSTGRKVAILSCLTSQAAYHGPHVNQRWDRIRITGVDSGRILRFSLGPGSGVKYL